MASIADQNIRWARLIRVISGSFEGFRKISAKVRGVRFSALADT
jgi:hypothetical protein